MIEVQYVGQLGNNLFQYALGRLLAEKLGMELRCAPAPGHETGHSLDKVWRSFADCPQHIPGLSYCGPDVEEVLLLWHRIDVAALLARREPRHIVLRGWFQRFEYFAPHRERIRRWFARVPASPDSTYTIGDGDIVILLRRADDYLLQGITLDLEYYDNILSRTAFDRLFVLGDRIDRAVLHRFARYRPVYPRLSDIDEFQLAQKFARIVIANSTFAWWAAYLSNAREIYYPRPEHGFWAPDATGHDLEVPEPRYVFVDHVRLEPVPRVRKWMETARALRPRLARALRDLHRPRALARAIRARATRPNGQLPAAVVALPKVFAQPPRRDPEAGRASRRCLIIQSDGEHKGQNDRMPSWYLRECYALQHAFQQNGIAADVWGRGHAGYAETPRYEDYDYVLCAENSDLSWLPDFRRMHRPRKLQWIIDLHCAGPEPYRAVSEQCDVILHATRSLMTNYAARVPGRRHLWFPNGCDDRYFDQSKWPLPKQKDAVFVGSPRAERGAAIAALKKRLGLEWFFCTGIDMIGTVASARIHFNQGIAGDVNFRVFETIGLGTCLLTNRHPDLADLGFVDGTNCLLWATIDDAVAKARGALADGSWARIGTAGHALARRHSYTARVRALLHELGDG